MSKNTPKQIASRTSKRRTLLTAKELSLVENNVLKTSQLAKLLKKTPDKYVRERPAKGGGKWKYVSGGYVKKVLNLMFGWDWDFEVIEFKIFEEAKEVVVLGRLTCRSNGKEIVKTQFGNKDIICKKGSNTPLSIGNDLKSATTDSLKKCAAEVGIAADIYNPEEFREIQVEEISLDRLEKLFSEKGENLSPEDSMHIERIIEEKDEASYKKAIQVLNSK